jgi:hypothetical protein
MHSPHINPPPGAAPVSPTVAANKFDPAATKVSGTLGEPHFRKPEPAAPETPPSNRRKWEPAGPASAAARTTGTRPEKTR